MMTLIDGLTTVNCGDAVQRLYKRPPNVPCVITFWKRRISMDKCFNLHIYITFHAVTI